MYEATRWYISSLYIYLRRKYENTIISLRETHFELNLEFSHIEDIALIQEVIQSSDQEDIIDTVLIHTRSEVEAVTGEGLLCLLWNRRQFITYCISVCTLRAKRNYYSDYVPHVCSILHPPFLLSLSLILNED